LPWVLAGTSSNTFGGSAQITQNKIFEHDNHFVMGMSIDGARLSAGDALPQHW